MSGKPNLVLSDQTVSIDRPISKVFEFVSNHENYVRWFPGVVSVISSDGLTPGTMEKVYSEVLRLPSGRQRAFDIRVVEARAPTFFATEGTLAPLHPRMEIRLTSSSETETLLNLRFYSRNRSAVGRLLVGMLAPPAIQSRGRAALAKLKLILEARK